MATAGTLFETIADRGLSRVHELIYGKGAGGPWDMTRDQVAFLRILERRAGKANAIPMAELQDKMMAALTPPAMSDTVKQRHRPSPRRVKEIVHELRLNFGVAVGASRDAEGGGYYLITSRAEGEESSQQMLHQAVSMLRVVAAMRGLQAAEMMGQLRMELMPGALPSAEDLDAVAAEESAREATASVMQEEEAHA